ncbi:MAG: low affinity potassium transporter [Chaenotheca gracillima]|nr:MAG: low affinity potassium transporter [Chaenotheca gracillima]
MTGMDHDSSIPPASPSRGVSNGAALSPRHKASLSAASTNGKHHPLDVKSEPSPSHTNGTSTSKSQPVLPDFFGHDREEVIRILIQSLGDLGYDNAAMALGRESGYDLESPAVAAFRNSVLHGEWAEAESLLFGHDPSAGGGAALTIENGFDTYGDGLVLAEGADRKEMLFWMRQQKFLELLEDRDLGSALMVLRQELTPLNQDIGKLHALSSLIMCQSAEDLKSQAEWDGAAGQSRHALLSELSKSISPSVMVPEHRLATLLQQVKQSQISNCLYHNTDKSPSLYCDHLCDRNQFPLRTVLELEQHMDEVWFLEFSHDGTRLATASKDRTVIIYDVPSFDTLHTLLDHGDAVAFVAWSPDDTKIISCARDHKAKVWDARTGKCLLVIDQHTEPVTACSWAPDGLSFVTGSLDRPTQLYIWNLNGVQLHSWSGQFRVLDCSITPDGQRLVVISAERRVFVYDYHTRQEEYSLTLNTDITCLTISHDSRYMLVNMANNEIHLLDIQTAEQIQKFSGQKQGEYVIRSAFGGAGENFVISGSEDSKIYIWNKENGVLVESLEGHNGGCVNAVAWNPRDPGMFASAGDDRKVRMWVPISLDPSPV